MNFLNLRLYGNDSLISTRSFNMWCVKVAIVVALLPLIAVAFAERSAEPPLCPRAAVQVPTSTLASYMHGGASLTRPHPKACKVR
jgi:hypothetical protein